MFRALLLLTALALPLTSALADPKGRGGGQGQGNHGHGNQDTQRQFTTNERDLIGGYYAGQTAKGHCPPGLAKKGNGCMPPGQARAYTIGQPWPAGVTYYALPNDLLGRLSPPAGYRYVQSGSDVLMLAMGSNMVVSALRDIIR
jgi:hypothetical protein